VGQHRRTIVKRSSAVGPAVRREQRVVVLSDWPRRRVRLQPMAATPKEFRASWETHLIAAGANTDDVAAIAGHSINVQAEHHRQALHRSSEFIKAAIG
jgi:integrase